MHTRYIFIIFVLFFSNILTSELCAQSLSGNVNSKGAARNLGYANVNIFKNGKLIANVLSDKNGNFSVKLDTGLYQCEINFAGYEKIIKEIRVTTDEKADFSLSKDEKSKYVDFEPKTESRTSVYAKDKITEESKGKVEEGDWVEADSDVPVRGFSKTVAGPKAWSMYKPQNDSVGGKLTAGEINDFSKWSYWKDLIKGELSEYPAKWQILPENRYTIQLNDKTGLPLANAEVKLFNGKELIFTAKTDNTGKAELWESIVFNDTRKNKDLNISINYQGYKKEVNKVKLFDKEINFVEIDTDCNQSQEVDIAIVVDATGSMQDEIDYLKYDLNDVIFKAKEFSTTLNLRFANIFYRDLGDQYVVQSQNFTNVLSESVAYTDQHNAGGGGDYPEAVELALDSAINNLSWNPNARTRLLFLVLDAPPHLNPKTIEKLIQVCNNAAQKGIRIIPIAGSGTNKETEYLMRCIALITNGTYVFLTNHSGIGDSHIKASTNNYQVEILNDLLVRVIKAFTYMPSCKKQIADLNVNFPDSAIAINNYIDTAKVLVNQPNDTDFIELKWKFYPNPTTGIFYISANKKIKELYVSDLSGKQLFIITGIEPEIPMEVNMEQYPTGIYLIRYPIGKQWISGKIMLVRK